MDDIERMKNALKQTTGELTDLGTKGVDTQFSQESCQKNDKFCIGLPVFLVLKQVWAL